MALKTQIYIPFTKKKKKKKKYGIDVKPSNSASKDAFCTTVLRWRKTRVVLGFPENTLLNHRNPTGTVKPLTHSAGIFSDIYWAKVLTDHPKNCDNVFVVQYFGMNFGTFNENTIWYQSCASAGIWHSACSLRMRKHTKPLKCTCNSRNDLNRNSNHRNLKNNVFALK